MPRDDYQARGTKCTSWTEYKPRKNEGHGNHPALITTANSRCTREHRICRDSPTWEVWYLAMEMLKQISTLDWQKQQQSSDDLTTCGDAARLTLRLNWTYTPPSLSLQPYTLARLGRVQLEYVSSWTSFTSETYGRFWALYGRTTWLTWRC